MGDMIAADLIRTVLVVDDSGTARMIIKQCLSIIGLQGKTFLEAGNGRDAIEILKDKSVDMVVTDLNMPVMDGESLLREIKGSSAWKKIPVIVITSSSNDAREKTLREVGAEAVVSKPVNPAALSAAWKNIIGAK
jgi:two-component system chemotaxis response regulator CheY